MKEHKIIMLLSDKPSPIATFKKTNKTKLQQEFEDQTPTIKVVSSKEYLQTYCVWLELQVEKYRASLAEEKMYSREEVEKLLWSFYYRQIDNGEEAGIWIKENL